jgi:hypothetical protein
MITNSEDIKMGRDVTIDVKNKVMIICTEMEDLSLYKFIKELWKDSPYHIKYAFPFCFGQNMFPISDWKIIGMSKLTFYNRNFVYTEQENLQ